MKDQEKDREARPLLASKVPKGRLNRFLSIGAVAAQMAAGGLAEKARRLSRTARDEVLPHALLTAENAQLLAARLSRLRGAAMKVGQMLSLEGDNLLPPEFARALEVLRSSAHRMPEKQVREVLTSELGSDFESLFRSIDLAPTKAASIGQVHRAVALDGRSLMVKVQYPGVAESIDSDVDNLRSLLSLSHLLPGELDIEALAEEIKRELRREVNYDLERENLLRYRDLFHDEEVYWVPKVFSELSSTRVITMEEAPGEELLLWRRDATQEERDLVATRLLTLFVRELFEKGLMQSDPNPANYFYDAEQSRLVLLDFGAVREVPAHVATLYRKTFRAMVSGDKALLGRVVADLSLDASGDSVATEQLVGFALDASIIFQGGPYDFSTSDLSEVLQNRGKELRKFQKHLRSPPPEFVFFQRKLAGTFLLCRQLGARVDCRLILEKHGIIEEIPVRN